MDKDYGRILNFPTNYCLGIESKTEQNIFYVNLVIVLIKYIKGNVMQV